MLKTEHCRQRGRGSAQVLSTAGTEHQSAHYLSTVGGYTNIHSVIQYSAQTLPNWALKHSYPAVSS